MALYLITGTPGAGKTLNTLQAVHKRAKDEGRSVYYRGITIKRDNPHGISFENWYEMPHPDDADLSVDVTPWSWQNAPDGSIILIDEAQFYYPATSPTARHPPYILDMSTHRHRGFDIYLITQGPDLINSVVKNWVQPHIHYRNLWGGLVQRAYVNEHCINNIRSTREIGREATRKRIKHDKRWYDCYVSASVHTKNRRFPLFILIYMLIALSLIIGGLLYVATYYNAQTTNLKNAVPQSQNANTAPIMPNAVNNTNAFDTLGQAALPASFKDTQGNNAFDPTTAYQPRIAAMPETAPAYDELRQPQTYPRPQCLISKAKDTCKCYTQQATIMHDYPDTLCREYATHGYFDPTRKDRDPLEHINGEKDKAAESSLESPLQGLIPREISPMPKYHVRNDGQTITADPLR